MVPVFRPSVLLHFSRSKTSRNLCRNSGWGRRRNYYLSNGVKQLSHTQKGLFDSKLHFYVAFLITCQTVKQFLPLYLDIFKIYIYIYIDLLDIYI